MQKSTTHPDIHDVEVIAPNLKRRLSGVTTTVLRLVPAQAELIGITTTGPGLPETVPHTPLWRMFFLPRNRWQVWHARRNTEMVLGLLLRHVLRRKLRLLFTSAAQRDHSSYTKALIAHMDAVIATSPQAASYLDRPATVIMHGVDTEEFQPANDKAALRYSLGLPPGVLIGCFGRVRSQKGVDVLVDAAIEVLPRHPLAKIVFTGRVTPDNQGFVDDLVERLKEAGLADRVIWRGEVSWGDLVKHFQAMDLFVAPARWEGFGLTPIEAMACGVPVIATRVGAFEAQVIEGVTGRLVAPGDAEALAAAMDGMLSDPVKLAQFGVAGRKHVLQNFTIQREAREVVEVYRDLLAMRERRTFLDRGLLFLDRYRSGRRLEQFSAPREDLLVELRGKRIAIVGNARALADTSQGAQIDAADLVVRINRAPRPSASSHGARTDWLGLATTLDRRHARRIGATRTLWMSHKRKRLPLWALDTDGFYLHPIAEFELLRDMLGAPPTTGLMLIDLVAESDAASIDLYGFDFFESLSLTGNRSAQDVPHDFVTEQEFVQQLLETDKRITLHPMK